MNSLLLTAIEACPRRALWMRSWESQAIEPIEILRRGVAEGLTTEREDAGEAAGELVMELCGDRGLALDRSVHQSMYDIGIHHASIADLVASHLRTEGRWERPEPFQGENLVWESNCFLGPTGTLRRVVLVTRWDDERLNAELHSWNTLGEMAVYDLPMMLEIVILGQFRTGRRHSAWTKGYLHPKNHKLRFARNGHYGQRDKPFGETWETVWREHRDEISRETWLEAMSEDGMIEELHLTIPVEAPDKNQRARLLNLIRRKSDSCKTLAKPLPNYSACDNLLHPCQFRECCWPDDSEPTLQGGFVRLQSGQNS